MTAYPHAKIHNTNNIAHTVATSMISACSTVINHYREIHPKIKKTDITISIADGYDTHFQCFENPTTQKEKYVITFGLDAISDKLTANDNKIRWTTTDEITSGKYMGGKLTPLTAITHTIMHECAHLIRYATSPLQIDNNGHDAAFHNTLRMMYRHNMHIKVMKELVSSPVLSNLFQSHPSSHEFLVDGSPVEVHSSGISYIGFILKKGITESHLVITNVQHTVSFNHMFQCNVSNESMTALADENKIMAVNKLRNEFELRKKHMKNELVAFTSNKTKMIGVVTKVGKVKATISCTELSPSSHYENAQILKTLVPYTELTLISEGTVKSSITNVITAHDG